MGRLGKAKGLAGTLDMRFMDTDACTKLWRLCQNFLQYAPMPASFQDPTQFTVFEAENSSDEDTWMRLRKIRRSLTLYCSLVAAAE